jgi:hypothetical protein
MAKLSHLNGWRTYIMNKKTKMINYRCTLCHTKLKIPESFLTEIIGWIFESLSNPDNKPPKPNISRYHKCPRLN